MTTTENFAIIAISMLVAGALAPVIIKWIIRKQKNWRFKIIRDNGRMDLVDEFNYWYNRLARERQSLEQAARESQANAVGDDVARVMADRLELLNKFLASRITGDTKLNLEAADELSALIDNRQEFMDSTRKAFMASQPQLMRYLESKGLPTQEQNYCCLYMIGLRAKEIGNYLGLRSHYNISSSIRAKLGLETNQTNLGIYLRKLMHGQAPEAETTEEKAPYTPRQVRGALLAEIFSDYLGLLIVACAYLADNTLLEYCTLAVTPLFLFLIIRALVLYRPDIMPVIRLAGSMDQLKALPLIGTITVGLLFAYPLIPEAAHPYIGYPSLILSQLLPLASLYRYTR